MTPDPAPLPATFFDGRVARRRAVALTLAGDHLRIVEGDELAAVWRLDRVRRVDGPADLLRFRTEDDPAARIEFPNDPEGKALVGRFPQLRAGAAGEAGALTIVLWSALAAASLILSAVFLVPLLADRIVPLVPVSMEQRLGRAVENKVRVFFRAKTCSDPDGLQALSILTGRLAQSGEFPVMPEVAVLDSHVPNAVAFPGGRIYLFDGLLSSAETPDEVAGVLAHEIGHVAHRDGLRKYIQLGGTSYLLGLLLGDVSGGGTAILIGESILNSSYSRDVERAADGFAMASLSRLGRSAVPMGELLDRISDESGRIPLLASHPLTDERRKTFESQPEPSPKGEPLLTPEQWRALRGICRSAQ